MLLVMQLVMPLLQQWQSAGQGGGRGEGSWSLVRLGNRLRLTNKEVEKLLPENVAQSDRLLDIEQKIGIARSQ